MRSRTGVQAYSPPKLEFQKLTLLVPFLKILAPFPCGSSVKGDVTKLNQGQRITFRKGPNLNSEAGFPCKKERYKKETPKKFNTVMSWQFCTHAMFYGVVFMSFSQLRLCFTLFVILALHYYVFIKGGV